jgi:hypothetical protein
MRIISICFFITVCLLVYSNVYPQNKIKHFIFFSQDRERIKNSIFYLNPGITGAQVTYPWKQLEPQKGKYDFTAIEEDLAFLRSKGKRLFIQIQDVTFDSTLFAVPKYILRDTVYHGGVNSQYEFTKDNKAIKAGWVARRWDAAVAERFHLLLRKLAARFDGKIEGINLPESSVDFSEKAELIPAGFTIINYTKALKANMLEVKKDFVHSISIQYANFMPGDSKASLQELYNYAKRIKIGMGGPDIIVYRKYQMENSYPMIREISGTVTTGMAVQEGNYDVIDPKTGKKVLVTEILDFAKYYLKLDYIFWCTEDPYYTKEVLPLLKSLKQ